MSKILVTGGSGFIGSHCILQLLTAGYQARTTVRSLKREADVRALLKQGGAEPGDRLSFVAADLENDAGWPDAVAGCEYVLHVASPIPPGAPKHEDELIVPARDGALRLLRAARDAKVKRVVLTSSFAAIGYGHKPQQAPFDETNWTDPAGRRARARRPSSPPPKAWCGSGCSRIARRKLPKWSAWWQCCCAPDDAVFPRNFTARQPSCSGCSAVGLCRRGEVSPLPRG